VEIGKSKNLPIAKNSPNHKKSPNSQSNRQIPFSKVQKLSNLEGTLPQDWLELEHWFVFTGFPHPYVGLREPSDS
jgi:hypothetical protein